MNLNILKFTFIPAICGLALSACSSDSKSSTSSDDSEYKINASATIDESAQTISMSYSEADNYCFIENGNYVYKNYTENYEYLFIGDTLIVIDEHDDDIVLTGGKENNIYGTWTMLDNCTYYSSKLYCYDSTDVDYSYTMLVTISKNKIDVSVKSNSTDSDYASFEEYTNSYFVNKLFIILFDDTKYSDYTLYPSNLFKKTSEIDSSIEKYSIQIASGKSNTFMKFTQNEQTYSIEILKALRNEDVELNVSSNGTVCNLKAMETDVITKSLCNESNADYFYTYTFRDSDDNSLEYVDWYEYSNEEEFNQCILELAGKSNSVEESVLYKKAVTEKNYRKIQKKVLRHLGRFK